MLTCYSPIEPDELFTRLAPLGWYNAAWAEVVECRGRRVKVGFEDVRFFVIDTDTLTVNGTTRAVAIATGWDIYLTRPVIDSVRVVKHEMMHVATQIFNHPIDPFYRCKLMKGQ